MTKSFNLMIPSRICFSLCILRGYLRRKYHTFSFYSLQCPLHILLLFSWLFSWCGIKFIIILCTVRRISFTLMLNIWLNASLLCSSLLFLTVFISVNICTGIFLLFTLLHVCCWCVVLSDVFIYSILICCYVCFVA